jgi:hypothetical protein
MEGKDSVVMLDKNHDRDLLGGSSYVEPKLQEQEQILSDYLDHVFGEGMMKLFPRPPEYRIGERVLYLLAGTSPVELREITAKEQKEFRELI